MLPLGPWYLSMAVSDACSMLAQCFEYQVTFEPMANLVDIKITPHEPDLPYADRMINAACIIYGKF
jgi:hypothetical protein